MSSLLVKNALAIVTVDDEDRILKNESILIEDGVITYIGKEARQADREIRADGCFVYPGLINTPDQHAQSPLSDLHEKSASGAEDGAVPLADYPV